MTSLIQSMYSTIYQQLKRYMYNDMQLYTVEYRYKEHLISRHRIRYTVIPPKFRTSIFETKLFHHNNLFLSLIIRL